MLVEVISERGPSELPCALVRGHAPFCWAATPAKAVEVAVTLEEVARMATLTTLLAPDAPPLQAAVRDKHFERKHGPQRLLRAVVAGDPRRPMSADALKAAEAKMRDAGQPEEAIRSFASAYERLESGESAMLPSGGARAGGRDRHARASCRTPTRATSSTASR